MQIILEETEIMEALDNYCAKQIIVPEGKKIKVDFTVGRGGNGTRATIDFEDADTVTSKPAEPKAEKKPSATVKEKKTEDPVKEVNDIVEDAAKEPETKEEPKTEEAPKEEPESEPASEKPVETEVSEVPAGDSLFQF